jgi:hypothetical protein
MFSPGQRWLEAENCMTFSGQADGKSFTCTVSEDTLQKLFQSSAMGRFESFVTNRQEIESVALKKIMSDGLVDQHLELEIADFQGAEAFIGWEIKRSP